MNPVRRTADAAALYAALNAARTASDLSWRDVAGQTGLSPSLFSRMATGRTPDVDGWLTLCAWLRMPAETFSAGSDDNGDAPTVSAQVAAVLAHRADLTDLDRDYLTAQIAAYEKWRTTGAAS